MTSSLLGALVLGHSLGSFGDGVLGEFSGKDETNGGLDAPSIHGLFPVVLDELSGLAGDSVEGVADEGVEDGHGSLGDSGVGVNLL